MKWIGLLLTFSLAAHADVRLPKYTREVLPNGAVVYLMPRAGVPLVNIRVIVKGGGESEPGDLAGLSSVTAQLLRKGTARRTAEQFANELDNLGGTLQSQSNPQATIVATEFLKKDFEQGLDLTADAVLNPAFPEAEVKKAVAQQVDGAKALKDNPQAAMRFYSRAFFYGPGHPYGHPADETTLARLTRDRIADYHRRLYTGKNIIVIVSGDCDPALAGTLVKKAFGAAPAGTGYAWVADAKTGPGNRLLLIDKPDATQTYFEIAQPGISRTNPDRIVLLLVNTLFGGRFTSMLNDELRVNSGLTYGAGSSVEQNREPGAIAISTYTRTETTAKAMDLALDVLRRLNANGITAAQLASAKASVKGTYPRQHLETIDQIASMLGEIEVFGLNRGEVDDFFSSIDAVTVEQANAAIRRHFHPENLTFIVLGNASKIRDAVKNYAPEIREVSIKTPGFGS